MKSPKRFFIVALSFIALTGIVAMIATSSTLAQSSGWQSVAPLSAARFALTAADLDGTLYAVGGTFGSCDGQQTLEAYDASTNTWTTRAPMPTGRYHAAAASLNGLLYVVGGGVSCGIELATVEAYDPATNSWATRAPLPAPRAGLRVAAANGKLYAMGGWTSAGTLHDEVWEYDSTSNSWTPKASMPFARSMFGIGVISGLIYVVGGQAGDNLASLQVYNPATNSWATRASMPTPRTAIGAAAIGGKLYAYGGSGSEYFSVVEAYDPATDMWSTQPSMLTHRSEFGAAASSGKLYAISGYVDGVPGSSSVESFQPPANCDGANLWTAKSSMPTARTALAAVGANGQVYAVGGGANSVGNNLTTVEAYDPTTDSWSARAPMNQPRDQLVVGAIDGKVYAAGGWQSPLDRDTLEVYDPATNTWTTKAPMPTARRAAAGGVINDKLYVVGGGAAGFGGFNRLEEYDPGSNTWATRAPMPTARAGLSVVALNGILYAIGGHDNSGTALNTLEAYNPATDSWTTKLPMPTARTYFGAAEIGGLIYAVGGHNSSSYHLDVAEAYDPATNTWITVPDMITGRYALAAASFGGTLYAIGGADINPTTGNQTYFSTVEAFSPACVTPTPTPTATPTPSPMPTPTPYPIVPKGNGRIAFTATDDNGARQIFTVEPDGSGVSQITSDGENFTPAFSPDGTRVAFTSTRDGNLEIYVMNADGSDQQRLTAVPRADQSPTWSPDGARIAFLSRRDAVVDPLTGTINFQIYVMGSDGSNQTRLTNNSASDGHPAWSPDGTSIAFQSNREGGGRVHLYLMNPDGTNQRRLFTHPVSTLEEAAPAWSPDGMRLIFAGGDLGAGSGLIVTEKLYSTLADGSDTVQVTTTPTEAQDLSPTYSPNGARIAFVRAADVAATVGSVRIAGSDGLSISLPLHDSIESHAVSWQPVTDTTAPVISADISGTVGSNGWHTSDVEVTLTATDGEGAGIRSISYSAAGAQIIAPTDANSSTIALSITAEGVTTITYSSTDVAGNVEAVQSLTVRIDKTPPVINVPTAIETDAASPSGAVITYNVSVTDNLDSTPVVTCVPPAASTFPIGTSIVQCTAVDASGHSTNASFNVTVNGASAQMTMLVFVIHSFNLPQGITMSLESKVQNALNALGSPNAGHRANACNQLSAFISSAQAQSGKQLTSLQANQLIVSGNQIRAALGCP